MNSENKAMEDDALIMIYLRNDFYKGKYFLALAVYLLSLCVVAILAGMLYYLAKHPTQPIYFPADDVGRLIKEIPLNQPNMSLEDATAWATEAVENAYSYDYINFRSQFQNAQKYFSAYGWRKYMQGLTASNNLVALTERKMIVRAKVVDQRLTGQGVLKTGAYGYKFEMQVLLTYMVPPYDDKSSFQNPLKVALVVQRLNLLQSYKGLGVMQMNANIASSAPPQNLTAPTGG